MFSFQHISKLRHWLLWKRFMQPQIFLRYVYHSTSSMDQKHRISKRDVYTEPDCTCVFICFVYGVLPSCSFFIWFILFIFIWFIFIFLKFQLFFFLRKYLHFDLIIATSELIVLVSSWRCTKAIPTFYAKVICLFMGCLQRLKQLWKGLTSSLISIFPYNIIKKWACLL